MQLTIVALFRDHAAAQNAMDDLVYQGFARHNLCLSEGETGAAAISCPAGDPKAKGMRHFMHAHFGSYEDRHARRYQEAIRTGFSMLAVHASSDAQVDRASAILDNHNAIDVDCYADGWAGGAWQPAPAATPARQAAMAGSMQTAGQPGAAPNAAPGRPNRFLEPDARLDDDTYYHMHWASYYERLGDYGKYEAAYRFGSAAANSAPYRERGWDDVEPHLRADWEREHTDAPWEQVREAVRHAWSRTG